MSNPVNTKLFRLNMFNSYLEIRTKMERPVLCATCVKPIDKLKDELSLVEFEISGMCQKCQDEVFNQPMGE